MKNRPFQCSDGFCGADDCDRCRPGQTVDEDCCDCEHFDSEDSGGWCKAADHGTRCGDSCPAWHDFLFIPNAEHHLLSGMDRIHSSRAQRERIDIMTDDGQTKNAASEGTSASPCSTPCPHQHPETWKCRWDGLMKPEGKCQPHTFEHRPMKWGRHASGFYSSIRCMVPNSAITSTQTTETE